MNGSGLSSRWSGRWLGLCLMGLALVSAACGGGGGGGGSSPTSPPVVPPTGSVSGNLRGTVISLDDPSTSFSGTEVELVGGAMTVVNASNEWGFENVAAGVHRLIFRGSNHVTREIRANVAAGGVSRFDGLTLVEPGPFRLSNFDEIYRSFSITGTIRWSSRPRRIVLDKESLSALPQGFDFFDDEVKNAFRNWLPSNTNGFFSGTPVRSGSIQPIEVDDFTCDDVEDGDIVIIGLDECPREDQFIILGTATHCFTTIGNEVILGAIWFNPCTTVATIQHEIIHTLCAGHLESQPLSSIMGSPGGAGKLTAMDRLHLQYLYDRQAGAVSPDRELDVRDPD